MAADGKMRRLSEPRDERGEFRRIRPLPRRAGEPEGLVTRVPSFGYFSYACKKSNKSSLNTRDAKYLNAASTRGGRLK